MHMHMRKESGGDGMGMSIAGWREAGWVVPGSARGRDGSGWIRIGAVGGPVGAEVETMG